MLIIVISVILVVVIVLALAHYGKRLYRRCQEDQFRAPVPGGVGGHIESIDHLVQEVELSTTGSNPFLA